MNLIQIMGRLGADPETRFTTNGQKVTSFRVATNSKRAGKEVTTWWRVTIWGDRFDKMLPYIKKGSAIIVTGELRAEIYMDKSGQPQISLEITAESLRFNPFGSPDRQNQEQAGAPQQKEGGSAPFQGQTEHTYAAPSSGSSYPYAGGQPMTGQGAPKASVPEDDLPF